MPAVSIGGATISLGNGPRNSENRTVYQCFIDLPDGSEYKISDLCSGCGGGGVQSGMESVLSFLSAAAESYSYRMRTGCTGENEDLFLASVVEWAYQNSDEIDMLRAEIEETPNLITE